ncbi:diguanylate cyclase domain-containing protein [Thiomonas intermedia]|uniref:diguanylate cyclase domain-containing protein n=1 Tax=Thiomonas intermedia TaxID=926 RepID=UPI0009A4D6F6|nr:diguanylate cyclase [Thiomonas intermedia]
MSTPETQNEQAPGYPDFSSQGRLSAGLNPAGEVSADQARAVLKTIPVGFAGGVVPAGVMVWLIHPAGAGTMSLWLWFAWMVMAHGLRVALWIAARRDLAFTEHAAHWLIRLRLGVLVLGLSWAALPVLLSPVTPFDELLVATVIAAVCGAGVAQQSSDAPSALLFMGPPAVSLSVRLLGSSDATLQTVGILSLLYFVFLGLAARRIHASFRELSLLHAQAKRQSLHDALTGLPNRTAFHQRLQEAIARARRRGTEVAVGYIDLDGFKEVNDTHGHEAGDRLLREVTRRWRHALRETELIARLGGDEFAILIEEVDPREAVDQLSTVFGRLETVMTEPVFVSAHQTAVIGMTMGVSRYPQDGSEPDLLLRAADAAMYQLKLRKATRTSWWQLGVQSSAAEPAQTQTTDPYGDSAKGILADAVELLGRANPHFIEAFYAELEADPRSRALLAGLDAPQWAHLKQHQSAYLAMLIDPQASREALVQRAWQIGEVHSLSGVSPALLARASVRYRTLIDQHLDLVGWPLIRRHPLLSLVEARLDDALQAQFAASDAVAQSYLDVLAMPLLARDERWNDALQERLDAMAGLPGVAGVAWYAVRADATLGLERTASAHQPDAFARFFDALGAAGGETERRQPDGASVSAWRTRRLARVDVWSVDEADSYARTLALGLDIRCSAAIPLMNSAGEVWAVLALYGNYPGQFAPASMQQWMLGVQHQISSLRIRACADH